MNLGTLKTAIAIPLLLYLFSAGLDIWLFRAKLSSPLNRVKKHWKQLQKSFIAILLLSSGVWFLDIIRLKLIALALNLPLLCYLLWAQQRDRIFLSTSLWRV